MEFLQWIWISFVTLLACYIFVNKVMRNLNEWYYNYKLGKKQYDELPPGDMGWPIIGNIWHFSKYFSSGQPNTFIDNLFHKYGQGGLYKTHLFGCPSIIVTAPEMCKKMLMDDVNFKYGYPKITNELAKARYLIDEGLRFKRLVMAPISGYNALSTYVERIEDIVIDKFEELSSMNHPVEFFNETRKISFKVIIHIFMGSCKPTIFKEFGDLFDVMADGLFTVIPIYLPGFTFYKSHKARNKLIKVVQSIIDERRMMMKNGQFGEKKDFLDILLEMNDKKGEKLVESDIIDFLLVLLLGGHETTAVTMMWSIIYLLQNPLCLKKAKEEQEEIVKARPSSQTRLSIKEIKNMVYLPKVLDETLRHINNAFSVFRVATTDMNINGYFIPKGWKVLVWLRAIHMNPEIYSNPEEFNPSRWDDYDSTMRAFLPFGIGRHLCPGSDLARFEITIFLHYYLLNYKLELINPKCPINNLTPPKPIDYCLANVIKLSCS